jgi:hypothetical protein
MREEVVVLTMVAFVDVLVIVQCVVMEQLALAVDVENKYEITYNNFNNYFAEYKFC